MTDLTPRQRAVLALVATGATNPCGVFATRYAEIAAALGLGEGTVRSHLKASYFGQAVRNLARAEQEATRPTLFDLVALDPVEDEAAGD